MKWQIPWSLISWWRHQMETFSALLAMCAGSSPVPGDFTTQRPVTRSFDVFFDLRPNKRLSKHCWGWWFETPLSCPLWRHRNVLATQLAMASATMDLFHSRDIFRSLHVDYQLVLILAIYFQYLKQRGYFCWNLMSYKILKWNKSSKSLKAVLWNAMWRCSLTSKWVAIIKIRQPHDSVIFYNGLDKWKTVFILKQDSAFCMVMLTGCVSVKQFQSCWDAKLQAISIDDTVILHQMLCVLAGMMSQPI